jgi:hypothetical protein
MKKLRWDGSSKRKWVSRHQLLTFSQHKERKAMPLDPDKLRDLSERAVNLSKRFDAFVERRKANDDAEDEDEDEDEDCDLLDPAEEALRNSPGSDLANPDLDEPWYGS